MDNHTSVLTLSDSIVKEHAQLIQRGVRPMVLMEPFQSDPLLMLRVATRLETLGVEGVVPFVIDRGDGVAECGFAADQWVVETFQWMQKNIKKPYYSRILGLLLGYSASAIHNYEQKQSVRGFTALALQESN